MQTKLLVTKISPTRRFHFKSATRIKRAKNRKHQTNHLRNACIGVFSARQTQWFIWVKNDNIFITDDISMDKSKTSFRISSQKNPQNIISVGVSLNISKKRKDRVDAPSCVCGSEWTNKCMRLHTATIEGEVVQISAVDWTIAQFDRSLFACLIHIGLFAYVRTHGKTSNNSVSKLINESNKFVE